MLVGGPTLGIEGQPITWDPAAMPIKYRVDPGPLAATSTGTIISNAEGVQRVQTMFGVWSSVSTAAVSTTNLGALLPAGSYTGGDVATATQFNDILGSCKSGAQNPIVFDANGSLIAALGLPPEVIGFAQVCKVDSTSGHIAAAMLMMNGKMQDRVSTSGGTSPNYELTTNEFDESITHEIGHFLGLDHSQINVDLMSAHLYPCNTEGLAGLPLMFPLAICQARKDAGFSPVAPDDAAWISMLYPSATRATAYGTIKGKILFSDRQSQVQGVNVIARLVDDPSTPQDESRQFAYSAISGYLFTGNPGQTVSGDNDTGDSTGSRQPGLLGYYEIPVPPGTYTVEVESIDSTFTDGSSVGPLNPPINMPGYYTGDRNFEYWNLNESAFDYPLQRDTITVTPGGTVTGIDIILNGTPSQYDQFEDSGEVIQAWPWKDRECQA